jgi:tripartite-type tricarboxylate transporter receptor subunit TctC
MKILRVLCLAMFSLVSAQGVCADTYPSRPITIIVPVPAGGGNDLAARQLGQIITAQTGQPVIISNRGGAGGQIGMSEVAKAAPDGYTLLVATSGQITTTRLLFKNPVVDPITDLEPLAPVADFPFVVAVNKDVPAKTFAEFAALVKARPGQYNYTSGSPGSAGHLAGEQLLRRAGIDLVHVPYRGAAPALTDVVAGQVQMIILGANTLLPYIRSGALRPLVNGSNKRLSYLPEAPTPVEAGLSGWEARVWFGFFGPRGLPKDVVEKLNGYVQKLHNDQASIKRMKDSFMEPMSMSQQQFSRFVQDDAAKWARIVKDAGIQPQ